MLGKTQYTLDYCEAIDARNYFPNAANAIGYRESIAFLKGEITEDELLPLIVKNTNGLVKKQKTWFRSQLPEPNERIYLSS